MKPKKIPSSLYEVPEFITGGLPISLCHKFTFLFVVLVKNAVDRDVVIMKFVLMQEICPKRDAVTQRERAAVVATER